MAQPLPGVPPPRGGLASLLGSRSMGGTPLDLSSIVRAGLPYRTIDGVAGFAGASTDEVATWLGLAPRTLDRRRAAGRIDARISEKVVRLARIATRAAEVLGSAPEMRRWLRAPNRALGHVAPVSLLDTEFGAEAVLDVLGRLEHGVFS